MTTLRTIGILILLVAVEIGLSSCAVRADETAAHAQLASMGAGGATLSPAGGPGLIGNSPGLRLSDELTSIMEALHPEARAEVVLPPGDEVFGRDVASYMVRGDESLLQISRAFDLGFNEITLANPELDPWLPPAGSLVRLPFLRIFPEGARRVELVINLSEMRLFYRRADNSVGSYPVGIGREGYETPLTSTRVVRKQADPSWYVPASIRADEPELPAVVPPGPENPLGTHAIYLARSGYLIHGTNQPYGIGRRVSHGCIRLYPEDIPRLFGEVEPGLPVRIVDQPIKAGWRGEELFLEVHPPIEALDRQGLVGQVGDVIARALARRPQTVVQMDWALVDSMAIAADGTPQMVGRPLQPEPPAAEESSAPTASRPVRGMDRDLSGGG